MLVVLAAAAVGVFLVARGALSYWVDLLWYGSLGYGEVFWTTLRLQWLVCAAFAVATFAILYGVFYALGRVHRGDLPSERQIIFGGQPVTLAVEPVLRWVGSVSYTHLCPR